MSNRRICLNFVAVLCLAALTGGARAQEQGSPEGQAASAGRKFDLSAAHAESNSVLAAEGLKGFAPSGLSRAADAGSVRGSNTLVPAAQKCSCNAALDVVGGVLGCIAGILGGILGFAAGLFVTTGFIALSVITLGILPIVMVKKDWNGTKEIFDMLALPVTWAEKAAETGFKLFN